MTENVSRIVISSDHAGFEMKEHVKKYLEKNNIPLIDVSSETYDPNDDYPVYAFKLAHKISSGEHNQGILFCGSGIGASIAANRVKGVRAALCTSPELARLAKQHNNSNVLVIGGRTTPFEVAEKMIDAWLAEQFEGGRHQKRIDQLDSMES